MKNNKGFTLIELLASISILAIICLIAVPSVVNLTNKSKKASYVNDAKRLITLVQYEMKKDRNLKNSLTYQCNINNEGVYSLPTGGIYLKDIEQDDVTKSPDGLEYTQGYVVAFEGGVNNKVFDYYVCLTDGKNTVSGSLEELNSEQYINYVTKYDNKKENCEVGNINSSMYKNLCTNN